MARNGWRTLALVLPAASAAIVVGQPFRAVAIVVGQLGVADTTGVDVEVIYSQRGRRNITRTRGVKLPASRVVVVRTG